MTPTQSFCPVDDGDESGSAERKKTPVELAIDEAGGLQKVAAALGVRWQAVWKWRKSKRVPAERVLSLEKLSGVSRHKLRPDIYPPAESLLTTSDKRALRT